MPIRVHCPSCDDRFVTSKRYRGRRVRCSKCGERIKIRRKTPVARVGGLASHSGEAGDLLSGYGEPELAADTDSGAGETLATVPAAEVEAIDAHRQAPLGGSADVLDFLAEEGGPEARRAGTTYIPTATGESVDEDSLDEERTATDEPAPKSRPAGKLVTIGVGGAVLLTSAVIGAVQFTTSGNSSPYAAPPVVAKKPSPAQPAPQLARAAPKPARDSTPAGTPVGPPVTVESASLEVEESWLASDRRVLLTIRNDGESALKAVKLDLGVISGLFEGSALFAVDFQHRFDSPLAAGASQEVIFTPPEGSALATQKLPPRAAVRARVVTADWL